jgi:hypothetical protein
MFVLCEKSWMHYTVRGRENDRITRGWARHSGTRAWSASTAATQPVSFFT